MICPHLALCIIVAATLALPVHAGTWSRHLCNSVVYVDSVPPSIVADCCTWSGSADGGPLNRTGSCSTSTSSYDLILEDLKITAISPGAFDNCGSPRWLTLDNNQLTSLAGVTFPASLRSLYLNGNKLTSLAGVTFPASLQQLRVDANQLTSLTGVTFQAMMVMISNNQLTSLAGVTFLASVRSLYLNGNKLTSLAGVTFPASLEMLDLGGNPLTSLADVTFPASLESLTLSFNQLTSLGGVTFPASLEYLEIKDIQDKKWVLCETPSATMLPPSTTPVPAASEAVVVTPTAPTSSSAIVASLPAWALALAAHVFAYGLARG